MCESRVVELSFANLIAAQAKIVDRNTELEWTIIEFDGSENVSLAKICTKIEKMVGFIASRKFVSRVACASATL